MNRAAVLASFLVASVAAPAFSQEPGYRSPYRVAFTYPVAELIGDLERTERGDPRLEAEIPFERWYSKKSLERWHSWGPEPRAYPVPREIEAWPVERKRERVIATALRFQGYAYQHHHIPDWNPPAGWPWQKTCAGRDGKGVDCSNLTGFVYNQAFGLRLNTDVHRQSQEEAAREPGGRSHRLHRVELPAGYDERLRALRTGDLVFIRSREGKISHVVIWVGPIGQSPDDVPLIIDSHGEDVRDSAGRPIPCGVQLRPFRKNSWYNMSASHALRVLHE
ncbi:NlpC/P60 family protein [Aquisphaera insulae]|uniref:NlpC/P60 family protein n=1 Tax=Aquisphaera insulae TaxID=2712864 RepID=UPI0013EB8624|nr:NlpC/P60 family protein [Aquisphaera insulae]